MSTSTSPVTAYAQSVVDGDTAAGPIVRGACERHLRDLVEGESRGLYFDDEASEKAIGFFRDVLCLNGGDFEGAPFVLLDWQLFIVGSLFGWKSADGYRRFRVCYVETGKGSGKSPLAAGIGMYGLVADGEARAEIYAAATKKDQAMILFRDAVAMMQLSDKLSGRLVSSGGAQNVWNIAYLKTGSFFRPISADDGASGPRPHVALLDEVHEHKNGKIVEFMRAGTKGRKQAIIFMITNSGSNRQSVCWDYHEYARQVCSGALEDDSFFGYVCSLDEGDDPFKDETCWDKANPSLGQTFDKKYLQEQVREARGMPSKEALVRRLNFCQWTEAENPWISHDVWTDCKDDRNIDLTGRKCFGGLDLASTQDLNALVLAFTPTIADPVWRLRAWFWLPDIGLDEKADKDRVPYLAWRDRGYLETTQSRAVDKLGILERLIDITDKYDVKEIAYDRYRIEDLQVLMDGQGYSLPPLKSFGQGYVSMAPALDGLEALLVERKVKHDGNPVLTWCFANAVTTENPAGDRKLDKSIARGRIDGAVASVMAIGAAIVHEDGGSFDEFLSNVVVI